MPVQIRAGAFSHPGNVRSDNEDACLCLADRRVLLVADGMGGHEFGGAASRMLAERTEALFADGAPPPRGSLVNAMDLPAGAERLVAAITEANRGIFDQLGGRGARITGSTAVALFADETTAYVCNVGDSRAYLVRGGRIRQITRDHTQVAEMLDSGILTEEQARTHPMNNVLSRAVGTDAVVDIDLYRVSLRDGDRLLLCSDGLTREVEDAEILRLLAEKEEPAVLAQRLVETAVDHGGHDNATVVLAEFVNVKAAVDGAHDEIAMTPVRWHIHERERGESEERPADPLDETPSLAPSASPMEEAPYLSDSLASPSDSTSPSPVLLAAAVALLGLVILLVRYAG